MLVANWTTWCGMMTCTSSWLLRKSQLPTRTPWRLKQVISAEGIALVRLITCFFFECCSPRARGALVLTVLATFLVEFMEHYSFVAQNIHLDDSLRRPLNLVNYPHYVTSIQEYCALMACWCPRGMFHLNCLLERSFCYCFSFQVGPFYHQKAELEEEPTHTPWPTFRHTSK